MLVFSVIDSELKFKSSNKYGTPTHGIPSGSEKTLENTSQNYTDSFIKKLTRGSLRTLNNKLFEERARKHAWEEEAGKLCTT